MKKSSPLPSWRAPWRFRGADIDQASSHREAPLIIEDRSADNTDVYAFVSPERPDRVALISNFIPLRCPLSAGGPNF